MKAFVVVRRQEREVEGSKIGTAVDHDSSGT